MDTTCYFLFVKSCKRWKDSVAAVYMREEHTLCIIAMITRYVIVLHHNRWNDIIILYRYFFTNQATHRRQTPQQPRPYS